MSGETITLIWLVAGLLLCASELVAPAFITVFLGVSAIAVAALRAIGLLEGFPASFAVWLISSFVMILALRRLAVKWFPAQRNKASVDETASDFGQEVEVLADIDENHSEGRVRYQGTTWPATTPQGRIPKGKKARIVYRENLSWVVEAVDDGPLELEAGSEARVPVGADAEREVH